MAHTSMCFPFAASVVNFSICDSKAWELMLYLLRYHLPFCFIQS